MHVLGSIPATSNGSASSKAAVARARSNLKRGGGALQISLDEALTISRERGAEVVALDLALSTLAKLNLRQSQVVELRFFGGLTETEIAEVLQISPRSVSADWSMARAWLLRELTRTTAE
jgi:RNA polymerase sigma-70 factor (ECF subfamily)